MRPRAPSSGGAPQAAYNRGVSRSYSLDDANTLVPQLALVTGRLRAQRDELVELRNAYRDRETATVEAVIADPSGLAGDDPELRRLRLRMRGVVDQMQADVAWLDEREIVLRDIATGLLDLPAVDGDRAIWLCWRMGEDGVGYWHGRDEGFDGRRPVDELDATARA